jgi:hypothetical protein
MAIPAISQRHKIDLGLVGQTISNSNATGPYYPMAGYKKALAICVDGASAVNKVTKLEWLQATAIAGTGAKPVTQSNESTGTESAAASEAAAKAIAAVTEGTITLSSMANAETVTINGVVFTAHTDTTTAADREFAINGDDTADAAALAGLINDATYGVPGVTATPADAVITLSATTPGTTAITVETDAVTHCIPAITKQVLYSEIDIDDLDVANGFVYVAPKVTKAGNGVVAVVILREIGAYGPATQHVAAGTDI